MASPSFLACTRLTLLALATTAAFAAGPWFRGGGGGPAPRGGRGGSWSGGFSAGGGHSYSGGSRFYAGATVRVLPRDCVTYRYRGDPWFYGGGHWYRPWRGSYAAFYPPVGLCLSVLPFGYATYMVGGMPYYYYEDVYYTSAPAGGYMVVEPPEEAAIRPAPRHPGATDPAADALLIVPKEGQSEQKMVADRSQAQRFAVKESGYDPAYGDPSDPGTPRARRAYLRALKSYLEERGYSVK